MSGRRGGGGVGFGGLLWISEVFVKIKKKIGRGSGWLSKVFVKIQKKMGGGGGRVGGEGVRVDVNEELKLL